METKRAADPLAHLAVYPRTHRPKTTAPPCSVRRRGPARDRRGDPEVHISRARRRRGGVSDEGRQSERAGMRVRALYDTRGSCRRHSGRSREVHHERMSGPVGRALRRRPRQQGQKGQREAVLRQFRIAGVRRLRRRPSGRVGRPLRRRRDRLGRGGASSVPEPASCRSTASASVSVQ